jgi:ribosomal protein L18E
MNYIIAEDRTQMKIKSIDSYVNENDEVIVIDKIVDIMDILTG